MTATAAALLSVLLYTALVASHIVSQATPGADPQATAAHAHVAGDPGCHEAPPAAGKTNDSGRDAPLPPKKCPFCTGYAAFNITVVGGSASIPSIETVGQNCRSFGSAQLTQSTSLPSWRSRAPPPARS